jgi:hypothetical protein
MIDLRKLLVVLWALNILFFQRPASGGSDIGAVFDQPFAIGIVSLQKNIPRYLKGN